MHKTLQARSNREDREKIYVIKKILYTTFRIPKNSETRSEDQVPAGGEKSSPKMLVYRLPPLYTSQ